MSTTKWPIIDPDDVWELIVEWAPELNLGETITLSSWTVTDGINVDQEYINGTKTVVWVSSADLGVTYTLKNTIETDQGRTFNGTMKVICRVRYLVPA